jgi:broad specificity phosphatase PhoE
VLDLWLIRHAQSLGNVDGRDGSQADSDLSSDGEAQAHELARELAGEPFDLVLASPLLRARRTAELALPTASVVIEPRLRELVVPSKGFLDVTKLDAKAIRELATAAKSEPERETGREFIARVREWIGALPSNGRVIAFTHFAVLRECLRQLQRGIPPQRIDYCRIHRVTRS